MYILTLLFYYLIIYPISLLPMRVLYILSDIIFIFIYYIFGYRKSVVSANLRNSFPEKSESEIEEIMKEFFRHLSDLIVESLKNFTISREEAIQRMEIEGLDDIQESYNQGRNIILAGGHMNNWELFAIALPCYISHKAVAIYSPLKNKFFDNKMKETRGKYGLEMIPMKQAGILMGKETSIPTATVFAIDQSPSNPYKCYWMQFLHQETAVFLGTERYAKKYDLEVFFGKITKKKRGYYKTSFKKICSDANTFAPDKITETITLELESNIKSQPAYWLWSHKRWKRKKPADYEFQGV